MLIDDKTKDEVFKQTRLADIYEMSRNLKTRHYFNFFEELISEREYQNEFIRIKSVDQVKGFLEALKSRMSHLESLAEDINGNKLHKPELDITEEWIAKFQVGIFKILQMNSGTRVPPEFSCSVEEVFHLLRERDKIVERLDVLYMRLMMAD